MIDDLFDAVTGKRTKLTHGEKIQNFIFAIGLVVAIGAGLVFGGF